jgi:hypothetical protein
MITPLLRLWGCTNLAEFVQGVAASLGVDQSHQGLGSFLGAVLASLITATAAISVGFIFTRRIKRAEAMTELSGRFQEVLIARDELNRKYYFDEHGVPITGRNPTPGDRSAALSWFRRFLSLIESEFDFYCDGLITAKKFITWMEWRNMDYQFSALDTPNLPFSGDSGEGLIVYGVTYREGWEW